MVRGIKGTLPQETAWALSGRNHARYFQAFAEAPLYVPFRPDDPNPAGRSPVAEAYGWSVLPVFTSGAGVMATRGEPWTGW